MPIQNLLAIALIGTGLAVGQDVDAHASIYVSANDGFDGYLVAALQKKKVPLIVVNSRERASYELIGHSESERPGWAKTLFLGQSGTNENATVRLVELRTGTVIWAYNVHKKNSARSRQSTAEACAKHLKKLTKPAR